MNLVIPASAWQAAIATLRQAPHDRERIAYLDGARLEPHLGIVTTVTVPQAQHERGDYYVSADEMSRAGKHLRRFRLVRLAQVHSHPTDWTGHSPYDDEMAFSQRDGAFSIVVPDFAGCAPGLGDCGVHVRDKRGWRELDRDETAANIWIVPSFLDLRA